MACVPAGVLIIKSKWGLFNSWWPCSGMSAGSFVTDETGRFLVFGERGKEKAEPHTFSFDPAGGTWEKLEPKESPPGRYAGRMAYHHALKIWVLVGGGTSRDTRRDTWVYSPPLNTWLEIKTEEIPSGGPSGAIWYDPEGEQIIYFAEYRTWTLKLRPAL